MDVYEVTTAFSWFAPPDPPFSIVVGDKIGSTSTDVFLISPSGGSISFELPEFASLAEFIDPNLNPLHSMWFSFDGVVPDPPSPSFGGPQGPDGFQGDEGVASVVVGPTGPDGPQGPQGNQGVAGPTGPEGVVGPEGPEGPQGQGGGSGPEGPEGAQGGVGPDGPDGFEGLEGAQGNLGPDGLVGIQGIQGFSCPTCIKVAPSTIVGPQGPEQLFNFFEDPGAEDCWDVGEIITVIHLGSLDGEPRTDEDYYQVDFVGTFLGVGVGVTFGPAPIAVDGYVLESIVACHGRATFGPMGFQGAQGAGTDGFRGYQGYQGFQGYQGYQGYQGLRGFSLQGLSGPQGFLGVQGYQGFHGSDGPQGPQGLPT